MPANASNELRAVPGNDGRWARSARWLGRLTVGAVVFVGFINPPGEVAVKRFDDSWRLPLAHFMEQRWQAGHDYIFTYGPLGYFGTNTFAPRLFTVRYLWEIAASAAAAFVLVRVLTQQSGRRWQLLAGYVLLTTQPGPLEARFGVVLLALFLWLLKDQPGLARSLGVYVVVVALGFVKFTLLALGSALTLVLALTLVVSGRWRWGVTQIGLLVSIVTAGWTCLGQNVANLPTYLRGSWELTSGYGVAMSLSQASTAHIWVAAALLLLGFGSIAAVLRQRGWHHIPAWGSACMLAGTLFLAWKEGFVRQDLIHLDVFPAFLAFFPLLTSLRFLGGAGWGRWAVALALITGSLVALPAFMPEHRKVASVADALESEVGRLSERARTLAQNFGYLVAPVHFRNDRALAQLLRPASDASPALRSIIGNESVDCFTYQQRQALVQGMNWRPRPVFQSYLAYTQWLLARNQAFLRSESAPTFVLLNSRQIDDRLFPAEDSLSYLELCRRYRAVGRDGQAVLLRRVAAAEEGSLELSSEVREKGEVGRPIALRESSGLWKTISVRMRRTMWGMLQAILYHAPPVTAVVAVSSPSGARGRTAPMRLIPSTDGQEVLIDPFLNDYLEFEQVYDPENAVHAETITVNADPAAYEREFEVTVRGYSRLAAQAPRSGTKSP